QRIVRSGYCLRTHLWYNMPDSTNLFLNMHSILTGIAMDERIRAGAIAAAQQLLLRYRTAHLQWIDDRTPIDDLVSWLGLHVETFHPHDYPQGTYGFLEPSEDLIW